MKKQIITIVLFTLVAMIGQAKQPVVWEKPTAFIGKSGVRFEITKVELKETETVMHITVNFIPNYWIRFAKTSFLQTPDGKKFAIISGAKTNEQEKDLTPDSLFWMPASGTAQLALHFEPVPLNTKEMDFMEGYSDDDFKFWNINNGMTKKKVVLPDEWKNVKYAKDETLPDAKINKGVATIKVKMLGYKPNMKLELYVGGFTPLGIREHWYKLFSFADDGTVTAEVPLWLAREVHIGVQGLANANIVIAPEQETHILMKITTDNRPFVAFKGYLAKTNMDLSTAKNQFDTYRYDENTYLKIKECNTPAERMQCLKDLFHERIAAYRKSKFTTVTKDLLCMSAEADFVSWSRNFAFMFGQFSQDDNGTVWRSYDNINKNQEQNRDMLPLSGEEKSYTWKYLNKPNSPCSLAFWETDINVYDMKAFEKNGYNADLHLIPALLKEDNQDTVKARLALMTSEDCKSIVREYQAEQERIVRQLATQEKIFYQKHDDVAPENILQTILGKYKGKAVLIDIWATWCGPCRAGHEAMKPLKEQMKGKNVQFVYITSPTSPLATWQKMIADIDGDHYYLTKEQYRYILDKYESNGIPTYLIYDTKGEHTYKHIGYPNIDKVGEEIGKAMR